MTNVVGLLNFLLENYVCMTLIKENVESILKKFVKAEKGQKDILFLISLSFKEI